MCDISLPIGAFDRGVLSDMVPSFSVVVIPTSITASVAVKIDNFSLMVMAYLFSNGSNLIGIVSYKITIWNTQLLLQLYYSLK